MKYLSTRGDAMPAASDILLEGLMDGGLYLPVPCLPERSRCHARHAGAALAYADLAFEILSLYIDDIPADELQAD